MKDKKNNKSKKGCLCCVLFAISPVLVLLLVMAGTRIHRIIHHEDYHDFSMYIGHGDEGYDALVLLKGDTVTMARMNEYRTCEAEGKFFHYHKPDGNVETKFLWSHYRMWVIPCFVAEYEENYEFLIADQKPLDSILGKRKSVYDENGFFVRSFRPNDQRNPMLNDKMLNESPIHQFWIIALCTADVYGPLSYEDYVKKRIELGVPPDLKLKCEEQFEK